MTFEQAMTTSRPQFTQVINSMSHDNLVNLCLQFESQLDARKKEEYTNRFAHEDDGYKAVLLNKLTFMYFILKP
jgi:phosphoheptose isomerase